MWKLYQAYLPVSAQHHFFVSKDHGHDEHLIINATYTSWWLVDESGQEIVVKDILKLVYLNKNIKICPKQFPV